MEKKFVEREWTEDTIGEEDENGFFYTPNGSFWDPDYVYFNREGFDRHGGCYDSNDEYIPGEGWDEVNMCYFDELDGDDDYLDEDDEGIAKGFEYDDFEYEEDPYYQDIEAG